MKDATLLIVGTWGACVLAMLYHIATKLEELVRLLKERG